MSSLTQFERDEVVVPTVRSSDGLPAPSRRADLHCAPSPGREGPQLANHERGSAVAPDCQRSGQLAVPKTEQIGRPAGEQYRAWAQRYRRAELVFETALAFARQSSPSQSDPPDILDGISVPKRRCWSFSTRHLLLA